MRGTVMDCAHASAGSYAVQIAGCAGLLRGVSTRGTPLSTASVWYQQGHRFLFDCDNHWTELYADFARQIFTHGISNLLTIIVPSRNRTLQGPASLV